MIAVLDAVHGDGSGDPINMRTQLVGRPERIPRALDEELGTRIFAKCATLSWFCLPGGCRGYRSPRSSHDR